MKCIGFAFSRTSASRILQNLPLDEVLFLWPRPTLAAMQKLVTTLQEKQPTHILGLGMYGGRDRNKMRVERTCTNQFHSHRIGDSLIRHEINYYLESSEYIKISDGIRTSYCNIVSYLIMDSILSRVLQSQYTFVHIPKGFNFTIATAEIGKQLENLVY